MIDQKIIQKLENSVLKNTLPMLKDVSVLQDANGDYQLFNKYTIRRTTDGVEVYGASVKDSLIFHSLKNAVAWCTNDRRVNISTAKRIFELDKCLCGIETDIQQHQKLAKSAKTIDNKLVYLAKLGEDKRKKKRMTAEMEGYISESRRWQTKRLNAKP